MRSTGLEFLEHGVDAGFYYINMGEEMLSVPDHLTVIPDRDPPTPVEVTVDVIRADVCQLGSEGEGDLFLRVCGGFYLLRTFGGPTPRATRSM